jgi:actin-related protein
VLLCGGGSNLRGLAQRLHWELLALVPVAFKPRIIAASPLEREHAAWIGGSILGERRGGGGGGAWRGLNLPLLHAYHNTPPVPHPTTGAASLGTFQQMWISKAEYEEDGPSIMERKCP